MPRAVRKTQSSIPNSDWVLGYFCAVAVLLKEEGQASTAVRNLYEQCGYPELADPDDRALFREHGLLD